MKKARIILWILFPISLLLIICAARFHWVTSLKIGNILTMCSLFLPVTAMALQTFENREKNISQNYFMIKLAFVLYLYLMIAFMFIITARSFHL